MLANASVALPLSPSDVLLSMHEGTTAALADKQTEHARANAISSGFPALDQALPNGSWPASTLIELLLTTTDSHEWTLLAPALAALTRVGKQVILIGSQLPDSTLLQQCGLDQRYVRLVHAEQPANRLWAIQEALDSADFGALLCWLPDARDEHLRRLQSVASACAGLVFAMRPAACRDQASPAPLRLLCGAQRDDHYAVQVIKRRGPVQHQPVTLPRCSPMYTGAGLVPTSWESKMSALSPLRARPAAARTPTFRQGSRWLGTTAR